MREHNQVVCAILHTDATCMAWSLGFRNLIIPGQVLPLAGMPYDHARNAACMHTLQSGAEWLFFLDSDVIPPRDAVLRLINHRKPIISGMYCRRSPPHSVPVMIKDGQWCTNFVPGSTIEVDVVGAGCLLMHRSLLEGMPPQRPEAGKHWFDWRVDCKGVLPDEKCLSEDFTMCRHIREKMGIPILVDTSIHCRHVGMAESTFGQFVPINSTPVT